MPPDAQAAAVLCPARAASPPPFYLPSWDSNAAPHLVFHVLLRWSDSGTTRLAEHLPAELHPRRSDQASPEQVRFAVLRSKSVPACGAQWLINAPALHCQSVHPWHIFPGHCCIKIRLHKEFCRNWNELLPSASALPRISARLCTAKLWREEFPREEREREADRRQAKMVPIPLKKKKEKKRPRRWEGWRIVTMRTHNGTNALIHRKSHHRVWLTQPKLEQERWNSEWIQYLV